MRFELILAMSCALCASGCLLIAEGVGVGVAVDSARDDGDDRSFTAPEASVETPSGGTGLITITFTLTDAEADPVDALVEFVIEGGPQGEATIVVGATQQLATNAAGVSNSISWDSSLDLPDQTHFNARIRVTPTGPFGDEGASVLSGEFTVLNKLNLAPQVTIRVPANDDSNDIGIDFILRDDDSDPVTIGPFFEVSSVAAAPGGVQPGVATAVTVKDSTASPDGTFTSSPTGISHFIVWDSLTDLGFGNNFLVNLVLTVRDPNVSISVVDSENLIAQQVTVNSGDFVVNNGPVSEQVIFQVGGSGNGVAIADLDGDGLQDVVVASGVSQTAAVGSTAVFVLRGDERDILATSQIVLTGESSVPNIGQTPLLPVGVAVADVLADQGDEVIVSNSADGTLTIFRTVLSPAFALEPAESIAVGLQPLALAVGLLDGDALTDVAVACRGSNTIEVLLGQPGGGLAVGPSLVNGGAFPFALSAGDLDGDGDTDLVAGDLAGVVTIFLQDAGGNLVQTHIVPLPVVAPDVTPQAVLAVTAADLNADGREDVVVGSARGLLPLLCDATGLPQLVTSDTGVVVSDLSFGPISAVRVAEMDGNSQNGPEILAGAVQVNELVIEGFSAVTSELRLLNVFPAGFNPLALAVGDLDGDGRTDVATVNDLSGDCSVFLQRARGTLDPPVSVGTQSREPVAIAIGDLDGGGGVEIVATNNGRTEITVFDSAPVRVRQVADTINAPFGVEFLQTAPGNQQAVVAGGQGGQVIILEPDSQGQLLARIPFEEPGRRFLGVAAGDVDGDGLDDVVVSANDSSELLVLTQDATGGLSLGQRLATGARSPIGVDVVDINGDGKLDVVTTGGGQGPGSLVVFLHQSDGTGLEDAQLHDTGGLGSADLRAGDLNGDGLPDLAVANFHSNDVSVFFQDGAGGLHPAVRLATGIEPGGVAIGDVNGDGLQDLIVANGATSDLSVFNQRPLNDPLKDASAGPPDALEGALRIDTGLNPLGVDTGDLNGDGKDDIAVATRGEDAISVIIQR